MLNNPFIFPNLGNSLDMLKHAWGPIGVPSAMAPTVDLDELDKRISDLKTVEQWLNLNLNLLRTTIQGLEVQRGTIAALKSFSDAFAANAPVAPTSKSDSPAPSAVVTPDASVEEPPLSDNVNPLMTGLGDAIGTQTAWWSQVGQQFGDMAAQALKAATVAPEAANAFAPSAMTPDEPSSTPARAPRRKSSSSTTKTATTLVERSSSPNPSRSRSRKP